MTSRKFADLRHDAAGADRDMSGADGKAMVAVDDAAEMNLIVDFDKWSAHTEDYSYGCEWNISEHDLEIKEG